MDNKLAIFENSPIIAAVKSKEQLEHALRSDCSIIFLLFGDICNIIPLVEKVKKAGKYAFIHLDLTVGLAGKEIASDFVKNFTNADGVISTRPQLLKRAKELELITVLRIFVIDSLALDSIVKQCAACHPDFMELMPGLMPKIIRLVSSSYSVPIIAGGLIREKQDIVDALSAGAQCISTTCEAAWLD